MTCTYTAIDVTKVKSLRYYRPNPGSCDGPQDIDKTEAKPQGKGHVSNGHHVMIRKTVKNQRREIVHDSEYSEVAVMYTSEQDQHRTTEYKNIPHDIDGVPIAAVNCEFDEYEDVFYDEDETKVGTDVLPESVPPKTVKKSDSAPVPPKTKKKPPPVIRRMKSSKNKESDNQVNIETNFSVSVYDEIRMEYMEDPESPSDVTAAGKNQKPFHKIEDFKQTSVQLCHKEAYDNQRALMPEQESYNNGRKLGEVENQDAHYSQGEPTTESHYQNY